MSICTDFKSTMEVNEIWNALLTTKWSFKNIIVLLKDNLPLFYFLLQSQVCQYLEDRPPLHRYYKVLPECYKVNVILVLTALTCPSTSLISLVQKYSKH